MEVSTEKTGLKINYAAGRHRLHGYFSIDAAENPKAKRPLDLVHTLKFHPDGQIVEKIPLDDGCAEELMACHILEHFFFWESPYVMAEWARLLQPGGLLVIECPDIELAASNLLNGESDQMWMWPMYGDPRWKDPFMCHRFGYRPKTLRALIEGAGFIGIKHKPPQTHCARANRDMRMEARKP